MEIGARVRRRHRRRVVVATAAVVVVAGAGAGTALWLTRSDGSTASARSTPPAATREASRFQMRPVLAVGAAPCTPGQVPGRAEPSGAPALCYTLGPTTLDANGVETATTSSSPFDGVGVDLTLTPAGADALNALAASAYGKPSPLDQAAFVVDGTVESAPQFNTSHFDDPAVRISGGLTEAEARRVVAVIAPPTSTTVPKIVVGPGSVADPCRALALADARRLLGPTTVEASDATARAGVCTYTTAQRAPISGVTVDAGGHPSISVQLWHGQVPPATETHTSCSDCIPRTVRPVAGIGDRAAWYQLAPLYQTTTFPSGNLDVQVGGTAVRITVDSIADAQGVAESAARILVPRLAR